MKNLWAMNTDKFWLVMGTIKIGDKITFKAPTRSHYRKATRVVSGISPLCVKKYHGWQNFIVQPHEVIEVHPQ